MSMTWLQDLRYALRSLRKRPGFVLLVVLTMAVAICATVGAFGDLSDFLRPTIDAPAPERTAYLYNATDHESHGSYSYLDMRAIDRVFGTYHLPGDAWPDSMGLGDAQFPMGWRRRWARPFAKGPRGSVDIEAPGGR